eukprot:2037624-Amphidinium_carterae.1
MQDIRCTESVVPFRILQDLGCSVPTPPPETDLTTLIVWDMAPLCSISSYSPRLASGREGLPRTVLGPGAQIFLEWVLHTRLLFFSRRGTGVAVYGFNHCTSGMKKS